MVESTVNISDVSISGKGNIFSRFVDKVTGRVRPDEVLAPNDILVSQSGRSIAENKAFNLDADPMAEVDFRDDAKFDRLMDYSKEVGAAIKNKSADMLPKDHGMTEQQVNAIFNGNANERQKALSENFNSKIKNERGGYSEAVDKGLNIAEGLYNKLHVMRVLESVGDTKTLAMQDEDTMKYMNNFKDSSSVKPGADYNVTPDKTKDMKNGEFVCRHYAPIGAAMLCNAGEQVEAFSTLCVKDNSAMVAAHASVRFKDTKNIAEFTAKPEDTYKLNVFPKKDNGVTYAISANDPKGTVVAYDTRSMSRADILDDVDRAQELIGGTNVVKDNVHRIGPEKVRDKLMSRDQTVHNTKDGMGAAQITPELSEQKNLEFAAKKLKEKYPEASKNLSEQARLMNANPEEAQVHGLEGQAAQGQSIGNRKIMAPR